MRVGVAGSSGFIGAALVDALTARGDTVVRFVRPGSSRTTHPSVRWHPERRDIDEADLRQVGGLDALVNLAGASIGDRRWSPERKGEILRSRLDATATIVQAMRALGNGVGVLANASAIGYYGSRGDEVLDERSTPGHDFLADVCVAWEAAAGEARDTGAAVTAMRSGIVLSPLGGALRRQLPLFRLGVGGTLGMGRQWLSPIALEDEVRAILWVIDHRVDGPCNLVAPTPLTNLDFTKALGAVLRRPTALRVPEVALRVALGEELARGAVLSSQRVRPRVLELDGFTFARPNIDAILAASFYQYSPTRARQKSHPRRTVLSRLKIGNRIGHKD